MYDIITTGSALKDIFLDTGLKEMKKDKKKFMAYPVGSKIAIKDMKFSFGGGGTNTAVGFSRLGLKTAYLGKVGNDNSTKEILDLLKKEKVDFIGKKGNSNIGHSIILDSFERNRTILTFKGPSNNLKPRELDLKNIKTKWFYFAPASNHTLKTQNKLAKFAKKNNIKIAFNPHGDEIKSSKEIKNILKNTNVLFLNKKEAQKLINEKNIKDIFKKIQKYGIETCCITNGEKKINIIHKNKTLKISPKKTKPVEVTGAGDAFASGFLSGLIKKQDINLAIKMGLKNSESVIKHFGSKNKLLTWKEIQK